MPAKLDGNSVLVVDDDREILTTVKAAFENSGASVSTASDGSQAVHMANKVKPDLIVLDMMMPRKSGFLVIESLKPDRDADAKPHIIMITANEGKRHELYARHLGVSDYMIKPFSLDRLLESACEILGGEYMDARNV